MMVVGMKEGGRMVDHAGQDLSAHITEIVGARLVLHLIGAHRMGARKVEDWPANYRITSHVMAHQKSRSSHR